MAPEGHRPRHPPPPFVFPPELGGMDATRAPRGASRVEAACHQKDRRPRLEPGPAVVLYSVDGVTASGQVMSDPSWSGDRPNGRRARSWRRRRSARPAGRNDGRRATTCRPANPGHGPRPYKTSMHRCGSLGIRLAHQTSLPNVDVPSTAGTRPPIRCAEKNPNPTRPPRAVLTPVPDVRGEHHRGGLPGHATPKPSHRPARNAGLSTALEPSDRESVSLSDRTPCART